MNIFFVLLANERHDLMRRLFSSVFSTLFMLACAPGGQVPARTGAATARTCCSPVARFMSRVQMPRRPERSMAWYTRRSVSLHAGSARRWATPRAAGAVSARTSGP